MNYIKHRTSYGFTLIELMIAVVIIAIIAAIALPSYIDSVRKSKRASAKSTMLQVSQREERYYTENNAYASLTTLGYSATTIYSDGNTHAITIAAGSTGSLSTSYVITATPQSDDPTCGNLTITNTGVWGNSVGAPVANC